MDVSEHSEICSYSTRWNKAPFELSTKGTIMMYIEAQQQHSSGGVRIFSAIFWYLKTLGNLSNCSNEHVRRSLQLSVEDVGKVASAAVLAIVHSSHENTSSTLYYFVSTVCHHSLLRLPTSGVGHSLLRRSILPSPSTL